MGSTHQTTNTVSNDIKNEHTKTHDIKDITHNNHYNEHTKITNNHVGNTYKGGVTDLAGSKNKGSQNFDLSAGLMNLGALHGANTAIVATPE